MLAEAGIGVLGIEGIDQQRVAALEKPAGFGGIESRRGGHLAGDPALRDGAKKGLVRCDHAMYFILQSTSCQSTRKKPLRARRFTKEIVSCLPPCASVPFVVIALCVAPRYEPIVRTTRNLALPVIIWL